MRFPARRDKHPPHAPQTRKTNRRATTTKNNSPSPPPLGAPRRIGDGARFHSYATDNYALHYLESPSGLRLALNTSPDAGDLREVLAYIYESLYIEYVVKNPLYTPGQPFRCARLLCCSAPAAWGRDPGRSGRCRVGVCRGSASARSLTVS